MADLTDLAKVKAHASVTGSGSDSAIEAVIDGVSAYLHAQVGHDYEGEPVTEKLSGGGRAIVLGKPVDSITSVTEGSSALAASAYDRSGRVLYRLSNGEVTTWERGTRNLTVVYTPSSIVPDDLAEAALLLSSFVWKQSAGEGGGGRLGLGGQANPDTGSAEYFAQAVRSLPFVAEVIRRYAWDK